MRLEQLMSRHPVTVHPDDKIVDASQAMRARGTSGALVVRGEDLVGIVTERDLVHKVIAAGLAPDGILVGEVMTPDPVTVGPQTTAWEAFGRMTVKGIRHLPVCEGRRPLGLVELRDLAGVSGDEGRVQTLLADLDEGARARVAEILLWAIERMGERREDVATLWGESD